MNELHDSSPADHVSLQMENELLALEARHLRARLTAYERGAASEADALHGDLAASHDQVLADMRWLLRRLNESPFGALLRRKAGFRVLLERYPQEPPA